MLKDTIKLGFHELPTQWSGKNAEMKTKHVKLQIYRLLIVYFLFF